MNIHLVAGVISTRPFRTLYVEWRRAATMQVVNHICLIQQERDLGEPVRHSCEEGRNFNKVDKYNSVSMDIL